MSVDLNEWQRGASRQLEDVKETFLDSLTSDQSYIETYGERIVFGHQELFQMPLTINLKALGDLQEELVDAKFILPPRPPELDSNIDKYRTHVFDDVRMDLFEKKSHDIYNAFTSPQAFQFNGENLQDAIQTAMYQKERQRDQEDIVNAIDGIANDWASDGYLQPPGAMDYQIAHEVNTFDRMRTDKTENVFSSLASTVEQNVQWAFENGINIEKVHMDFTISYSELSKVIIGAAVDAYVAEIEKRSKEFQAMLKKIDTNIKSLNLDLEADIKKNELELSENTARLAAHVSSSAQFIDSEASLITEQIKLGTNVANGFGAIFSAYGAGFTGISLETQ